MEIEKILNIDTNKVDKLSMILSNNIDFVYNGNACISIYNWEKLKTEILAFHEHEMKKLNRPKGNEL
jgi:hypothetical protein